MTLNTPSLGYSRESTEVDWIENNQREEWTVSRGVEAIVEKLSGFQDYDYFHDEVKGETVTVPSSGVLAGRFSAMTIWHKPTLGSFFAGQVFSYVLDNSRPLLFVITKKDKEYTLLINLHAPNKPAISTANYTEIAGDINDKCMSFLGTAKLTMPQITNIYMVGDFNDRYGGLLTEVSRNLFRTRAGPNLPIPGGSYSGEFKLGDTPLTFNSSSAPTSCCYNWDSTKGISSSKPLDGDVPVERAEHKSALSDERGGTDNYYYLGDYCFSSNGGELVVDRSEGSNYSDHQLVYLTDGVTPTEGGRRKTLRKKSTRRHKKMNHKKSHKKRRSLRKRR
jgi:hypothetical protein